MCSKVRLWHLEKYDRCQDQVLSDICPVKKTGLRQAAIELRATNQDRKAARQACPMVIKPPYQQL